MKNIALSGDLGKRSFGELTFYRLSIEFREMRSLTYCRSLLLVLMFLPFFGCERDVPSDGSAASAQNPPQASEAPALVLNQAERAHIDSLRERGGLRVAISNEDTIYEEQPDGTVRGLHYRMTEHLGEVLDLSVSYTPVYFAQFFELQGEFPAQVLTDPDFRYTPDLLKTHDFYAGTFTPLPWREKILDFIPVYLTRLIFISRQGEEIDRIADLEDKRIAIIPNTSYQSWFETLEGINPADLIYVESRTGLEAIEMVSAGEADVTISDANLAIVQVRNFGNLNVTTAASRVDELAWAVAEGSELMRSILEKYIDWIKADGSFEEFWTGYYGISSVEYLELIGYHE